MAFTKTFVQLFRVLPAAKKESLLRAVNQFVSSYPSSGRKVLAADQLWEGVQSVPRDDPAYAGVRKEVESLRKLLKKA